MSILVSIIIVAFNRKEMLLHLIGNILEQTYNNFEIIVIDDCSSENIADLVRVYPQIKVVKCRRRFGPAFAKNLGILKARGRYILFLDTDVEIINKNLINDMIMHIEGNNRIGQIGGELVIHSGVFYGMGKNISFDGNSVSRKLLLNEIKKNMLFECDYIPTSNCLMKRTTIFKIGGFDPYFIYPGEDKDFGYRLKKDNYKNYFGMDTLVVHNFSKIVECKEVYYYYYRNKIRFVLKNHGSFILFLTPFFDAVRKMNIMLSSLIKKIGFRNNCDSLEEEQSHSMMGGRPKTQAGNRIVLYLKALYWNMLKLKETAGSRKINYLEPVSIREFVKYAEKTRLFEKEIFY